MTASGGIVTAPLDGVRMSAALNITTSPEERLAIYIVCPLDPPDIPGIVPDVVTLNLQYRFASIPAAAVVSVCACISGVL